MRKAVWSSLGGLALVLAGFGTAAADDDVERVRDPGRTYQVTITNRTSGQWFTPAVVATHRRSADFYSLGRPASFEVREIAENGNVTPLLDSAGANPRVSNVKLVPAPSGPPPIAPGASVTFDIDADDGALFLSWVSMLICTNDGFAGVDSVLLPLRVGHTANYHAAAYDAGTERNSEAWEDLVPPCAQLTGFGNQGGTGTSNPALAENGRVRFHRGISGAGDLVPSVHGWRQPVASVSVTRVR